MTTTRIYAPKLFDGHKFYNEQVLTITDGKIIAIDQDTKNIDVQAKGLIAPGFIDLQVNGGGGVLFNDSPSLEKLETMMLAHAKFGTTGMMPTLITDKIEVMEQAVDVIAQALSQKMPGILGIHFEGPHLSLIKKGTHSAEYIRPITDDEWQILTRKDIGKIMVTLAPETVSLSDISRMVELGIIVCLGHSNADFVTAQKAVDAGALGFTHLFNAMSPLQGREPGVVGCALLNDQTHAGLIVDGHHVDYASCRLAIKTKPKGSVFLVTDAMPPVGTDMTEFPLYDRTVYLEEGKLTSTTGELAGSSLDMASAVKNTHLEAGVPLDESLRMASLYPAQFLFNQQQTCGEIKIGNQADFIVLNDEFSVIDTWINGEALSKFNA